MSRISCALTSHDPHNLPHEDLRDAWSPAKVLHRSTELAGIAKTGSLPPFLSPLSAERLSELAPVAQKLVS
jgi:hypothetical protein